jgi:hypothetical protein
MRLPRIADIQRAVAAEFGVPLHTMREPAPTEPCLRNNFDVAHARQVAIALSFVLTDHSRKRIGDYFGGRDHTTVLHACRQVEKRRPCAQRDAPYHARIAAPQYTHGFDRWRYCCAPHGGSIESSMRDLQPLIRILNRIEDPSARKLVIMSKRERRQITDRETERLIQLCGVVDA